MHMAAGRHNSYAVRYLLQIANMIRHMLQNYSKVSRVSTKLLHGCSSGAVCDGILDALQPIPAVLEIPSKEHPYDPSQDSILSRVQGMLGAN